MTLSIDGLTVTYPGRREPALDDVALAVSRMANGSG